jgi:gamma-glutamyltranspeptidase / glutathione hydrolase
MHRPRLILRPLAAALLAGTAATPAAAQQHRPDVAGTEAAIVADHPLAAAAGAEVLRAGGNAIDAAVTMAAVLAVVQPHVNGVGGDAVALYRDGRTGRVFAINGTGRSPDGAVPQAFRIRGVDRVPADGVLAVTVPGAVRLWADLLRRFGTLSIDRAVEPAIRLAEAGFPVSGRLAGELAAMRDVLAADAALATVFMPGGRTPPPGTLLRQTDLGRTLRAIARNGPDAFYVGEVARAIDAFMRAEDGLLTIEDLAGHSSTWQEAIRTTYHGLHVLAFPPNSQGMALLLQLNMAEQFDLRAMTRNSADYVHTLAQIARVSLLERDRFLADPAFSEIPLPRLISKEHARLLLRGMADGVPDPRAPATREPGGTTFLAVVDAAGNMVAVMQTLAAPFGSGRMVPGTGVVLHNAGAGFSLDPADPNVVAPRKRAPHSLAPALMLRADGSPLLVAGSAGGDAQTQALVQVLNNIVLFGLSPQAAVEAARWRVIDRGTLRVEEAIGAAAMEALLLRGYDLQIHREWNADVGSAQVILVLPGGVRSTGADPRRDGYGIAW